MVSYINPAAPRATEKSCKQGAAWPRENAPTSNPMNTYMHTYIHTYTYTYIHTCIHTYIHTHIQGDTYNIVHFIIIVTYNKNISKCGILILYEISTKPKSNCMDKEYKEWGQSYSYASWNSFAESNFLSILKMIIVSTNEINQ